MRITTFLTMVAMAAAAFVADIFGGSQAQAQVCRFSDSGRVCVCRAYDGWKVSNPSFCARRPPRWDDGRRDPKPPKRKTKEELRKISENKDIQRTLNAIGCEAGTVDGIIGRGTRAAIRCFQSIVGRPTTGELSTDERSALIAAARKTSSGADAVVSDLARAFAGERRVPVDPEPTDPEPIDPPVRKRITGNPNATTTASKATSTDAPLPDEETFSEDPLPPSEPSTPPTAEGPSPSDDDPLKGFSYEGAPERKSGEERKTAAPRDDEKIEPAEEDRFADGRTDRNGKRLDKKTPERPVDVETAEPTEEKAPVETAEPTEEKAPVETAEPTEEKAPVETAEPTEEKAPVETAEPTEEKAPVETAEPTEEKAPVETAEPTEEKAPVETAEPTEEKAPIVVDAPTEKETKVAVATPEEEKAPGEERKPSDDKLGTIRTSPTETKRACADGFKSGVWSYRSDRGRGRAVATPVTKSGARVVFVIEKEAISWRFEVVITDTVYLQSFVDSSKFLFLRTDTGTTLGFADVAKFKGVRLTIPIGPANIVPMLGSDILTIAASPRSGASGPSALKQVAQVKTDGLSRVLSCF